MKTVIRTLALSLVVTGIAAGALSKKTTPSIQVVPASVPMPSCPFNSGDCGLGHN